MNNHLKFGNYEFKGKSDRIYRLGREVAYVVLLLLSTHLCAFRWFTRRINFDVDWLCKMTDSLHLNVLFGSRYLR